MRDKKSTAKGKQLIFRGYASRLCGFARDKKAPSEKI